MKFEECNEIIRNTIKDLIKDGYKKNQICSVTLGGQRYSQMENFLNGSNLGVKPLSRVVETIGYDLMLVPVHRKDTEAQQQIRKISEDFIESFKHEIIDFLENSDKMEEMRIRKRNCPKIIEETVTSIFQHLGLPNL